MVRKPSLNIFLLVSENQFPHICWPWLCPQASQKLLTLLPQSHLQIFRKSCFITTFLLIPKPGPTFTHLSPLTHSFDIVSIAFIDQVFPSLVWQSNPTYGTKNTRQYSTCGLTIQSDAEKKTQTLMSAF